MSTSFTLNAIGVVRSGFADKFSTPRQPFVADAAPGRIELHSGHNFADALCDLDTFSHIWVLFVFDQNATWHPKVMPPHGSDRRRGVFATRSPHRPNPIGMSVLQLLGIDGLMLHVAGLDILDGTPVLDIKPYVPMADIVQHANRGWLPAPQQPASSVHDDLAPSGAVSGSDQPQFAVTYAARASEQLAWWRAHTDEDLRERIDRALAIAPAPHAYRRIRKGPNGGLVLGMPGWRVDFVVRGSTVEVLGLRSAHKQAHFDHDPSLYRHREFVAVFGG